MKSLPKYVDMKKAGGATGGLRSSASSACEITNNSVSAYHAPENLVELTQRSHKIAKQSTNMSQPKLTASNQALSGTQTQTQS